MKQLILASLSALLISVQVQALPEDSQQPINIEANRASQTTKNNIDITEYTGNVQIVQGSLKINGDHIVIHSENRQVVSMVAKGSPVLFEQQSDPAKPPVKARGSKLKYLLKNDSVVLTGDASIDQNGSIVSGERIQYNIASEQVKARGGKEEDSRVRMILVPEREPNTSPAPGDQPQVEASTDTQQHAPATATKSTEPLTPQ